MSVLSRPYFHDEAAAFAFVESIIWANGPVCSHCGGTERIYPLQGVRSGKSKKNPEGAVRHGLKKCGQCRGQFTVRIGTIFEESKLPLTKWLQAIALMAASKKGVSSHQLHRTLEVTYKTAWFLSHRIREAMRDGELAPFGSGGGMVEVDETYIGHNPDARTDVKRLNWVQKNAVLTLIDRDSGKARSMVVEGLNAAKIAEILSANVAAEARLRTDEAKFYITPAKAYAEHGVVAHAREEYVSRTDPTVHTNTVEGFYSIFKRGMKGVYQHCSKKHLHRYAAEFDFRYSNRIAVGVDDTARATLALKGIVGKRLTYRQPDQRPEGAQA
jgi:transposase-like protein